MPIVAIPEGHTTWDTLSIRGSPSTTLRELLSLVSAQHHGVSIEMLATPSGTVFYNWLDLLGRRPRAQGAHQGAHGHAGGGAVPRADRRHIPAV